MGLPNAVLIYVVLPNLSVLGESSCDVIDNLLELGQREGPAFSLNDAAAGAGHKVGEQRV